MPHVIDPAASLSIFLFARAWLVSERKSTTNFKCKSFFLLFRPFVFLILDWICFSGKKKLTLKL